MSDTDLEPLAPQDALDWYLEHRRESLRTATRRKHRSALGTFVDWTEATGIDDLNHLGGRDLMEFKTWRKREADVATVSLNGNLAILQRFLRFCATVDAVEESLVERVPLPNVPPEEEVNYEVPSDGEVERIRSYFRRFERASRRHVTFELVAEVGVRLGAVCGIDLGDLKPEDRTIHLLHRPEATEEYGTPLKNGPDGERIVNLSEQLLEFILAYIEHHRHDVLDEYGREPLFTTASGRPSTATFRRDFYKMSRPCVSSNECPHDREISECEATKSVNAADCPSVFTTHPLRKWSIMTQLDAGMPKELLSDRVDVSVPMLDKHYDQRSQQRKSKQRRAALEANLGSYAVTDGGTDGD